MENIFEHLVKLNTRDRYQDRKIYDPVLSLLHFRIRYMYQQFLDQYTNIPNNIATVNGIMRREIQRLFSDNEEHKYFNDIEIESTIIDFFNKIFVEKKRRATANDLLTHNIFDLLIKKGGKIKKRNVRKHRGIIQKGGNKGRLKKGYKYTGRRLKNGKPEIIKIKK